MNRKADVFAGHLLSLAGVSHVPPVDVEDVARRLGVYLCDKKLVEDGRLEVVGRHIEIQIRSGLSATRRRFTVAHELGHLILPCPGARMTARRAPWHHSNEERLCDEIAAAIPDAQ